MSAKKTVSILTFVAAIMVMVAIFINDNFVTNTDSATLTLEQVDSGIDSNSIEP